MINISKYNSYKLNEDNLKKQIFKFNKLNLKTQLLKGMIRFGIYFLTPIQKLSLLSILDGRDVMLSSQSGSGKTTCYAIGLINSHIGDVIKDNQVQLNYLKKSLIIAPTRELALQITTLVKSLSVYTLISIRKYIGGTSHLTSDVKTIRNDVQIFIGTPGRLYNLINLGILKVQLFESFVLDEVDILLEKNFKWNIYNIYRFIPDKSQIIAVSSSLNNTIIGVARGFMKNAVKFFVRREEMIPNRVLHYYIPLLLEDNKIYFLLEFLESVLLGQTIIFCNTIRKAIWIYEKLKEYNFFPFLIHSQIPQTERIMIDDKFKKNKIKIIIATDVYSRGIYVQRASTIINYDLPQTRETYAHRAGRCGSFGKEGSVFNLVKLQDIDNLVDIEQFYSLDLIEFYWRFSQFKILNEKVSN